MERERCLEVVQVKIKNNSYMGRFLKKNIMHNEMSRKKSILSFTFPTISAPKKWINKNVHKYNKFSWEKKSHM